MAWGAWSYISPERARFGLSIHLVSHPGHRKAEQEAIGIAFDPNVTVVKSGFETYKSRMKGRAREAMENTSTRPPENSRTPQTSSSARRAPQEPAPKANSSARRPFPEPAPQASTNARRSLPEPTLPKAKPLPAPPQRDPSRWRTSGTTKER